MLDAYIIERIRRERDAAREQGGFIPLRIDVPEEPPPRGEPSKTERDDSADRGSVIIDFSI